MKCYLTPIQAYLFLQYPKKVKKERNEGKSKPEVLKCKINFQLIALAISGVLSAAHNRANDLECYYQSKFDSEISDTKKCDTSGHHNPICFSLQLPDNKYERGCIGAEEVMKDYPTEKGCKGEVSEFILTQLKN